MAILAIYSTPLVNQRRHTEIKVFLNHVVSTATKMLLLIMKMFGTCIIYLNSIRVFVKTRIKNINHCVIKGLSDDHQPPSLSWLVSWGKKIKLYLGKSNSKMEANVFSFNLGFQKSYKLIQCLTVLICSCPAHIYNHLCSI